ncbi:WD40-repeat-containing domain protein [Phlyctochytrium arcticum]|nr:WD40-repeat-containing domain protein [Phlyctochytrium arcticum]
MSTAPRLDFVSVGCNRVSQATDWTDDSPLAYAAGRFVALYDPNNPSSKGVFSTLRGHSDRVNCLRYIRRGDAEKQRTVGLVSGGSDKVLRLWELDQKQNWSCSEILSGHQAGISCVGVARGRSIPTTSDIIASASTDGAIKIWERTYTAGAAAGSMECVQTISSTSRHALCLAIGFIPNTSIPLLIVGGTDNKVTVYTREGSTFEKKLALQGHTDWIRSVEIATYTSGADANGKQGLKDGDVIFATASQDKYVRIWKISEAGAEGGVQADGVDDLTAKLMEMSAAAGLDGAVQLSTKAHIMEVAVGSATKKYNVMFDALLMGHDDWVHGAVWQPATVKDGYHQPMALLSASADKSMMVWRPEPDSGTWINEVRLGEIGGSTLGFYGGQFSADGKHIVANGYNGAIHVWKQGQSDTDWAPAVGVSGHYKAVEDLRWDPQGQTLLSASLDQTSRLFSEWKRRDVRTWHEIARPQIHGYDLHCLAFVHRYAYVSGADEKVLRVFEAPRTFVKSLASLTQVSESEEEIAARPVGASVPALGLSNKAVFEGDIKTAAATHDFRNLSAYTAVASTPTSFLDTMVQPPFEQHLLQHTLWPEVDKLYGHGYAIITVAASHNGRFVASACKAAKAEDACVRLWSTKTWREACPPLVAHNLTVTGVHFSPDDRFLLTVGRDRAWALFELTSDGESYQRVAFQEKAHARIIWKGAWAHDSQMFATGSRDKTVKLWTRASDSQWSPVLLVKFAEGVTALDFAPCPIADNSYLLAVGLEDGSIQNMLIKKNEQGFEKVAVSEVPLRDAHAAPVRSLQWRPVIAKVTGGQSLQLASCSEDFSVRIFAVPLPSSLE